MQEPEQPPKHLDETGPKFRFALPALTNLAIIALFFCTFCQVKSCSGNYKPVTGMQLVQRTAKQAFRDPRPAFFMSPVLITLGTAILSLAFCLSDPQKLQKRSSINGIVGGLSMSGFILFCLIFGVRLALAPMLIVCLHFANPLARYFRTNPQPPPEG